MTILIIFRLSQKAKNVFLKNNIFVFFNFNISLKKKKFK